MNHLEYIARQFSRTEKKTFEHYVVTRIWHQLDDIEIKFVTQQYVKRLGGIALTDMYFPQLKVHVEIDEGQHFDRDGVRILQDKIREADIINATAHLIKRIIIAGQTLIEVHKQISELVIFLKDLKEQTTNFRKWDFEAERNPLTYINRGYIALEDDVAFKTMVDAANCFGNNYKRNGIWKGGAKHRENDKDIWFPKLYENAKWNNSISEDDNEIREICKYEVDRNPHIHREKSKANIKRIVFAKVISPLGDVMYRFKGLYEIDTEKTNYENGVVLKRIATRVQTFA